MGNILEQVVTYQESQLALMQNLMCFVSTANTKFKNFQDKEANLGDTVNFDLPPRFTATNTLVAAFQAAEQRSMPLTCGSAQSVAYQFSAQEFIFNVDEYMDKFGRSAAAELATVVEADIASGILSAPYRFYGNGTTVINSYGQLAEALALYRNFGAPKTDIKVYLEDMAVPAIINSGLGQFVLDRNKEIANSWELGTFNNASYYMSNLLPVHTAGTLGNLAGAPGVMTVTGINAAGDQLSVSSGLAVIDANAILENDLLEFFDGVAGVSNVRFLTFIGHITSAGPVQMRATADAASTAAGAVVIPIDPPLISAAGPNQNVSTPIVAGMELRALPSHRRGMICGGGALYVAAPKLPEEVPFPTANKSDPDTGVSMRMYYGSQFGLNQRGFITDIIYGSTIVPEYSMALIFPL
jgi:hypothetical protein